MSNLPAAALIERRALINAVNAASAALHSAAKAVSGDIGLVNDREAIASAIPCAHISVNSPQSRKHTGAGERDTPGIRVHLTTPPITD